MREGRLGYNCENGRYGLLSMDLWVDTGFHWESVWKFSWMISG